MHSAGLRANERRVPFASFPLGRWGVNFLCLLRLVPVYPSHTSRQQYSSCKSGSSAVMILWLLCVGCAVARRHAHSHVLACLCNMALHQSVASSRTRVHAKAQPQFTEDDSVRWISALWRIPPPGLGGIPSDSRGPARACSSSRLRRQTHQVRSEVPSACFAGVSAESGASEAVRI